MILLEEKVISCPCCGEYITVLIDCSVPHQTYVEDCRVCCRPVLLTVHIDSGSGTSVQARCEND